MTDLASPLSTALADRYRIERELGRGGMATVHLAHDLRHDRDVAIKVLRPELTAILGGERFLQEIRVTARLAHPHILPLLDSGQAGGFLYYVTPYVEGQSLRQRLADTGSLSLPETARITRGVASALDAAHRRGIIHRDIKPENILIQDGEPLVADFGIALAVSALGRERLTETGLSLGTPAYMSPEQASAEPRLDGRSDQYSLACVVYEMLAAEPPYTGPTAQAIIAKRMTEPLPRLGAVREVPLAVEQALNRGLARNPADRFAGVADFAQALESAATSTITGTAPTVIKKSRGPSRRIVALVTGLCVLVAVVLLGVRWSTKTRPRPAPMRQVTFSGTVSWLALSHDGNWLAWVSGDTALMVQDLAGQGAITVLRASFIRFPAWSPDGAVLCAGAQLSGRDPGSDAIYEIPRLGGKPLRVGAQGTSCDYSPDGKLFVATEDLADASGIARGRIVITDRPSGRVLRTLMSKDAIAVRWSPDGHWLASTRWNGHEGAIDLLSVDGSIVRQLRNSTYDPTWTHAVWGSPTSLYLGVGNDNRQIIRVPLNGKGIRTGGQETVMDGLNDVVAMAVSGDGHTLAIARGTSETQVLGFSMSGSQRIPARSIRPLTSGTKPHNYPAISPDGQWVAWIEKQQGEGSIVVAPFSGEAPRVIKTYRGPAPSRPLWAPDSRRLGYVLADSTSSRLLLTDRDGTPPVDIAPVGPRIWGFERQWAWAGDRVLTWSGPDKAFLLTDPVSHNVERIPIPDSLKQLYSPVGSPDGSELIATRMQPWGAWNDLWRVRFSDGKWTPVRFDVPANAEAQLWDKSGLYIFATGVPVTALYHQNRPGAPPTTYLADANRCHFQGMSFSQDRMRMVCVEATTRQDAWIANNFDPEAR